MKTTRELIQLGLYGQTSPTLVWDPAAAKGEFTLLFIQMLKAAMRKRCFSDLAMLRVPASASITFKDYLEFPNFETGTRDITIRLAHDNARIYGVPFRLIPEDADALYLIHGGIRGDKQLIIGTDLLQDNVIFGCY